MFDPSHPPDLSTKAGRKAYRHELRMVAVRPRRWGLWLLAAGALLAIMPSAFGIHSLFGLSPTFLGMIAGLAAMPLLAAGAMLRRRYHRARMRGAAPLHPVPGPPRSGREEILP